MQRVAQIVAFSSLASTAVAVARTGFEFPASVPMHKRQTSGPAYQCHANCGYTILGADADGYCEDPEWNDLLEQCLNCAIEYDIWGDYGEGVTAAAEGCGLDATPVGSDDGSDEQTTTEVAATSTVQEGPSSSEDASTTVAVEPTVEPTDVETLTSTWETTFTQSHSESHAPVPTPTWSNNSTIPEPTNEPSPVPTAGAAHSWISGSVVAGAAMFVAVNLM